MTKKRIINIRITCVVFVGLMLGILFCRDYILSKLSTALVCLSVISLLLVSGGINTYAILTSKYNENIRARKKLSPILKISGISFVIAFLVGIIITISPFVHVFTLPNYQNQVHVYGRVSDYVVGEDTYTKFLIDRVKIDDGDKVVSTNFKMCVYTSKLADIALGSVVDFDAEINKYNMSDQIDASRLYQDIGYQCFVESDKINILSGNMLIKDKIKNSTKDILENNLNEDNSEIFFAILFGEKQGLNEDIKDMFSYSGISHILAVSGLHIGVLVSVIYFVLNKIKMNKYLRLGIFAGILIFYSYLCSFTPSVCRASIMAILLCICNILKREYDSLSALSIAGIIILLCNPFNLFSVSFQLSFLCIFAIISLAPTIERFLVKIKCPKFLAVSLGMSIATNIAILPVCANVFYKVSLLGVITNIFVLPIFSLTYILLFGIILISLILNFMGFLLIIPNLFLQIIKVVATYVSDIPFGIFRLFNISYWSLVLIIACSTTIHFIMVRKLIKSTLAIVLALLVLCFFVLNNVPKEYSGNNIVFCSKYNSNCCYYIEDGNVTLIGSDIQSNVILIELKKLRLNKIDNIIAYDLQLNEFDELLKICKENKVKNVYIPKEYEYAEIKNKFENVIFIDKNLKISNLNFETIIYSNKIIAITIRTTNSGKILIPKLTLSNSESSYLSGYWGSVDILYLNKLSDYIDIYYNKIPLVIVNKDNVYYKSGEIKMFDVFFA